MDGKWFGLSVYGFKMIFLLKKTIKFLKGLIIKNLDFETIRRKQLFKAVTKHKH